SRNDVIPWCSARGIGFVPFRPLAQGLLTGKYRESEPLPPGSRLHIRPEEATPPRLARAAELGASPKKLDVGHSHAGEERAADRMLQDRSLGNVTRMNDGGRQLVDTRAGHQTRWGKPRHPHASHALTTTSLIRLPRELRRWRRRRSGRRSSRNR